MILGTAGHIDHGKTALVRALTGVDTDRLPEEKRRGITIELGFAPLRLDGVGTIGVVDVPGHEAFVRTMLAGATGIDLALLVVAADEGVMPQTREHLAILSLLDVGTGVVALTKCDLVDDDWLELVREDLASLLTERGGPLAGAPIVATSTLTGQGIDELRNTIREAALRIPKRSDDDLFRLPVDRAFTIKGTGTVVTGTVWTGKLRRDAGVRLLPGRKSVRVRGLQSHGAGVDTIEAGNRAAVALAGAELSDVGRGSVLVTDAGWGETRVFRADASLLDVAESPLRPRTRVRLHLGTAEVGARIVVAGGLLSPGEERAARVVVDEPLVLRAGDRFVLRAGSPPVTVGGGVVTDPLASLRARPFPATHMNAASRLEHLLAESGAHGVELSTLPIRLGVPLDRATELAKAARAVSLGARLVDRAAVDALRASMLAALASFHAENPLLPGASLQSIRSRLAAPPEVMEHVLAQAIAAEEVQSDGGELRLAGWQPRLSPDEQIKRDRILAELDASAFEPPSVTEIAAAHGAVAEGLLRLLEREGKLVQVEPGRYYTVERVNQLLDRLRQGMSSGKSFGPSELREFLGFSRKFLIPFLEYTDRIGFTVRHAEGRTWRGT